MSQKLSEAELKNLKASIGSLEESIEKIYLSREPRALLGEDGILVRTLGENYKGLHDYQETYFDKRRGKWVKTELTEALEALDKYDSKPSVQSAVNLLLEVGDILFQKTTVERKHRRDPSYNLVINKFKYALSYFEAELQARGLSLEISQRLAEIKYGIRAWLMSKGFRAKDKELEMRLCVEEYVKNHS